MNQQEFAELAAGYALNALSPDDLRAFESARAAHPEWEREVDLDVAAAALLADSVADAAPPRSAREALLGRIAQTPQLPALAAADAAGAEPAPPVPSPGSDPAPNTETIQAVSRRNWTRGMLALAASMVLLVVLGFGAVSINELVNRPAAVVALQEIEAAPDARSETTELVDGGTATAHWSESLGKAVLVSDGLPAIADDQAFELWFVRGGEAISAGTFDAASGETTTAVLDGSLEPGDTIAVTVEEQGGSASGQPTTEPIIAIPTA